MNAIAIVTARGGSKRVPRKNARDFAGRPMIGWPVEAAVKSGLFTRVLVSTDDSEIAEAAQAFGAESMFRRPAELADDESGTLEVMGHAVDWALRHGENFKFACCLYGTAAFTTAEDLRRARDVHADGQWNYVFAAGRFQRPPQRSFVKDDNGAMKLILPQFELTRSQDLAPTFYDAGQFYWGSTPAWTERKPIYHNRTTFIELPPERAVDIDTPADWAMAERQFSEWKRGR